ncbi:hypothetical protein [Furfurilactobacillus curtus]|uniref:Uncharacterized protein n=1 Tax=Furfurilactobacillus curtus TaxID=1746200 RepID=A0ABQ5JRM2_9LACO
MKPVERDYHKLFVPRRFGFGYNFNTRSKGGRFLARSVTIAMVLYMVVSIRHGKWAEEHGR